MGETATVYAISLLGLVLMLLFALAVVGFYVYYQDRLLKQQRKLTAWQTQQQQQLMGAGIQSQEVERQRIATDLHDSVGALLTTSQLFVRQVKATETTQELKETALGLLDEVLVSIRNITRDLAPETLFRFGLAAAVEDVVNISNQLPNLEVRCTATPFERFDAAQELAVFRIIQELLANTIKHAKASTVSIELTLQDGWLRLVYQDDGQGLPSDIASQQQGFGLPNIRSRSQLLKANLNLPARPEKGFFLELKFVPLPRETST
ncbi:MAG: ATP-binding protein [Bacteroidota bacterium]